MKPNFFNVPPCCNCPVMYHYVYVPVQLYCYLLSNPAACPRHQNNLSCHVPIVPKSRGSQRLYCILKVSKTKSNDIFGEKRKLKKGLTCSILESLSRKPCLFSKLVKMKLSVLTLPYHSSSSHFIHRPEQPFQNHTGCANSLLQDLIVCALSDSLSVFQGS